MTNRQYFAIHAPKLPDSSVRELMASCAIASQNEGKSTLQIADAVFDQLVAIEMVWRTKFADEMVKIFGKE